MLELLNPTALDVIRFAAKTLSLRQKIMRTHTKSPAQAYALVAESFMTLPESAKRKPDIERLRDDSKRYFRWTSKQWKQVETSVQQLISSAKHSQISHLNETVHCYEWKANTKASRGRILLCHGWEGYALNFAALITAAREQGWDVSSFDHIAHGNSSGKLGGLPISLSTLLAVSKHVGNVDILIGHSLGGAAAAWAGAHKKITAKRIVLISPFYDTFQLTRMWAKAHLLNEEIRAGLQSELEKMSSMTFEDFMPTTLAPLFSKPVLVVHDPKDPITSFRHSKTLASLNSKIKLAASYDTGHVGILADASNIKNIIAFCDEETTK